MSMRIATAPKGTSPELYLQNALFAFRRKLMDALRQDAKHVRFTVPQWETLRYVASEGDPTMKEIAGYLNITPPSVTAIIETLAGKGLITRKSSPKDRRTVRILLAPKALKLIAALKSRKEHVLSGMLSKLSAREKKQLAKILTVLIAG